MADVNCESDGSGRAAEATERTYGARVARRGWSGQRDGASSYKRTYGAR